MIPRGPACLVIRWVQLYTQGLPHELAQRRRDEIRADLWSQFEEAAAIGRAQASTEIEVLIRWMAGIPADLSWRFEHRGDEPMVATRSLLAGASSHRTLGVATVVAGLGLTTVFLLFVITSQLMAPANPYYTMWPGVVLVLGGSACELVLAGALFGFAMSFLDDFRRPVTVIASIGGLMSAMVAVGAFGLLVYVPIATVAVAWELSRFGVISRLLGATHAVAAAVFMAIALVATQTPQGSPLPGFVLLGAWPLTLARIGIAVSRVGRAPLSTAVA